MFRPSTLSLLVFAAAIVSRQSARCDEPLHSRIDALIAAKADGPLSPPASDAEFLRRAYLDLVGRIPTTTETREFFEDESSEKRSRLIDQLLDSDEHPPRMAQLFHVMLMERRGDHDEWQKFLQTAFAKNKPWDRLVAEICNPDAGDEKTRGAALFITKRLEKYGQNPTDYPGLVRDFGRLFLGVDVQCAQCHDHLFIDDYKQQDFQGLYAFVANTSIRRDTDFPAVGQNPLRKKLEFVSVFDMQPLMTGPRLPGVPEVDVPVFKRGEEYETPPDKKTRSPGVLKFNPLKILSEQLPTAKNDLFKSNIVNRLWWVMMGRGIVHPLDLHHSKNPPSHPELLLLLSDKFAARKFDIKWLVRELALTQTYARSGFLPEGSDAPPSPARFRVALERPLAAEQLLKSAMIATGQWKPSDPPPSDLADLLERFRAALANPPREPELEFSPSVKSALFLMNDEVVQGWLQPRDGNLVDRLAKIAGSQQVAEELYLSVLTRNPTAEEVKEVDDYLSKNGDRRPTAIGNLTWALLASTEFCINH